MAMGDKISRQRAYKFIKGELRIRSAKIQEKTLEMAQLHGLEEELELAQLHKELGGKIGIADILKGLHDGTLDPTEGLVTAFRNRVGTSFPEERITAYLITPFIPDP